MGRVNVKTVKLSDRELPEKLFLAGASYSGALRVAQLV